MKGTTKRKTPSSLETYQLRIALRESEAWCKQLQEQLGGTQQELAETQQQLAATRQEHAQQLAETQQQLAATRQEQQGLARLRDGALARVRGLLEENLSDIDQKEALRCMMRFLVEGYVFYFYGD